MNFLYHNKHKSLWVNVACGREQSGEQLKNTIFQKKGFFKQTCPNLNAAALSSILMWTPVWESHQRKTEQPQQEPKRKYVSGKNEVSHQGNHPSTK